MDQPASFLAPAPVTPHSLWQAWSFAPTVLILIGVTTLIYVLGMWRAARRATTVHRTEAWRWLSFAGAMLSLVAALISPLDAMSGALFSAHMVQHLILMMITAPLLALSELPVAVVWALPRGWAQGLGRGLNRSRAWQALTSPVSAWLLFAATMWIWHASTLYEAALRNETIHTVEHLSFVLASMLFWWVLFRRTTAEHVHYGMVILYLFTTMLQSTILGALMTFTSLAWYSSYASTASAWGLTPLEDQQLAGLIMWMPGGVVFTLMTIGYFAAWFRALERRSARLQQNDAISAHPKIE